MESDDSQTVPQLASSIAHQGDEDRPDPRLAAPVWRALALCPGGVIIVDAAQAHFPVVYANAAMCRMTDRSLPDLLGKPACALFDSAAACAPASTLAGMLAAAQAGHGAQHALLCWQHSEQLASWRQVQVASVDGAGGATALLACFFDDVSELAQMQARLAHTVTHDELTGLANGKLFDQHLHLAIARAAEQHAAVAVVCVSLGALSVVNDSLGQAAAAQFVLAAVERLKARLGPRDRLARHASNELVLILEALPGQDLEQHCRDLCADLTVPVDICNEQVNPAPSIGFARLRQDGADGDNLLRFAQVALRHGRSQPGRNVTYYTADMGRHSTEGIRMEAALRQALEQDGLELHYQPLADLQDGAVCKVESLLRWEHPQQGLVGAREFAALAEGAGLSIAIGQWALRRACCDLRRWRDSGVAPARVSVNLSPAQFCQADLVETVSAALQNAGIPAASLMLEVTEQALMSDPTASAVTLDALKALGVGLALDDFGTGYFSLNHLARFPLDLVKIDSKLVANIVSGSGDAMLVKTIISMAHQLGLKVAAVGVNDEAQCDFLRRNMCDQVQGSFFAAPADLACTNALLAAQHHLPAHLLRIQKPARTLLLVDDEQNIVSALKRVLRLDGYQILLANSGQEGLEVLAANAVDVIVSDQRMPGMIGADFLRAAKDLYPKTIRIMLSGYTELQSVTDAVNEGAIYKFLTKPWDDDQLRSHIAEAFRLKEVDDENERLNLALRTANQELARANRSMEQLLLQKQRQIRDNEVSLNVARELLQFIPLPVIGLDEDGMVAFINHAAETVFSAGMAILGQDAALVLPELFPDGRARAGMITTQLGARRYQATVHRMGAASSSRGSLITLSACAAVT